METDTKDVFNPIRQDTTNTGQLREYHGPIYWNYGFLPQTWEDPNAQSERVSDVRGDNDPVDVVEVGPDVVESGFIVNVKVLGALSLIDQGELDWKILAIKESDENFGHIESLEDLERYYPHTVSGIREWFRWYKTPDGKRLNKFAFGGEPLGGADAREIIQEAHESHRLMLQRNDHGLWVPSSTL